MSSHVQGWFLEQDERLELGIGFADKFEGDLLKAMVWNDGGRGLIGMGPTENGKEGDCNKKRQRSKEVGQ